VIAPLKTRRKIVIVGGGAGGLELATSLGRARRDDVLLVDKSAAHVWKPRLHEVAAGLIGSGDDQTSYLVHAQAHRFSFAMGELIGIDPERRAVRLASLHSRTTGAEILGQRDIGYDVLALAFGSRVTDFGVPGVLEHCHMLDSATQAERFQRCFLEAAVQVAAGGADQLRVGIVGAGATGIELAAELHHAVNAMCQYGGLGARGLLSITLIDQSERVLPAADPKTSVRIQGALERLGVHLRLAETVQAVDAEGFHLGSGDLAPCSLKVWAAGVTGPDMVSKLDGLSVGRGKRLLVDDHLACVGAANILALGDCATAVDSDGRALWPPTAQVAHQQAAYLARALRTPEHTPPPFRYRPMGMLVSLGEGDAAAEFPAPLQGQFRPIFEGAIAKLLYVSLYHMHRAALHGATRAAALALADGLRRTTLPPVKLH
jgi:NADH dehydrogenase